MQYVDSAASEATHTEAREAYDAFLNRYPYCYGYWKKYADYEKRNGGAKEKAMMVFERGIAAIPLSVDLWIHYLVSEPRYFSYGLSSIAQLTGFG